MYVREQLVLNALLTITAVSAVSASSELRAQIDAERSQGAQSWIDDAFVHTHHSAGRAGAEWAKQIELVQPDVVQVHVNAQQEGRELADRFGFRLCFTINDSGEYDYGSRGYSETGGFYPRVGPKGEPYGRLKVGHFARHLCFNSPAVDEQLIPRFVAATQQYHPDQIWIDSTVITVNYCYCRECRRRFYEEHGKEPPQESSDPLWPLWIDFHRGSFVRWMERLTEEVWKADPDTIVTFNHAYSLNQPEPPPSFIKNLSADIHSHSLFVGLYSRYATTAGVPYDVMIGLTDTWGGARLKPERQLHEEIAAAVSCGGSWNIGEFPASNDVQPADDMMTLAKSGADFARARRPWAYHTHSVPCVAVLNSATTHYARVPAPDIETDDTERAKERLYTDDGKIVEVASTLGDSRIYWQHGRDAQPCITGAYEALVENQIHFDIVNENTLTNRVEEFELVILPEQFALTAATRNALRTYVKHGGNILATGSAIEAGLEDVLGVKGVARYSADDSEFDKQRSDVTDKLVFEIKTTTARELAVASELANEPSVTINDFGEGQAAYINTDLFDYYVDHSPYNIYRSGQASRHSEKFLTFVAAVLTRINPRPRLSVIAPRWIDVALRSKGSATLLQLLNRSDAYRRASDSPSPIEIDLSTPVRPESVVLQPAGASIPFDYRDGRLRVKMSTAQVPVHSILEIK